MGCFCHAAVGTIEQWAKSAQEGAAGPGSAPTGPTAAQATGEPAGTGGPNQSGGSQGAGSGTRTPLGGAASAAHPGGTGMRGENVAQAVAQWLAARDLPAKPWTPDPAWVEKPLPQTQMGPREVATISALAQLRAQAQAQFGLDLLQPTQAHAFSRIVATMNARLATLASQPAVANFSPKPWVRLASLNSAVDRVNAAMQSGALKPTPAQLSALTHPGAQPMSHWTPLVTQLRRLAPLVAASHQLKTSTTDPSQLAAALKTLSQLSVPAPAAAAQQVMASLTAGLSAVDRLQTSLGVKPTQVGYHAVATMVRAKLNAMLRQVAEQTGTPLQGAQPETVEAQIMARLPQIPPQPGSLATPEAVQAAQSAPALAGLTWKVPPSLPATANGLPACSFIASVQQTLGAASVQARPCASGCDAARLMQQAA